jgi:hypothetical protein
MIILSGSERVDSGVLVYGVIWFLALQVKLLRELNFVQRDWVSSVLLIS